MPKQITQTELRAVLDHYQRAFECALAIRRRLDHEGATIEPGRYSMKSDGSKDPVSDYGDTDMSAGLAHWGIDIYETKAETPEESPEWITETPAYAYLLYAMRNAIVDVDGPEEQKIDVTLEEFESLKRHLAKMRGHALSEVAHV